MKSPARGLSIIIGLALLAALAVGAFLFFKDIYRLFVALDPQVAVTVVVALIAALFIALSIRRSGQVSGVRCLRLERKAEIYGHMIQAWSRMSARQHCGSLSEVAAADLKAAEQRLVLWASTGVLKQFKAYRRMNPPINPEDPAILPLIEKVLREMRRDLGQHNLGLGDSDLVDLLLGDIGDATSNVAGEHNPKHKPRN
jgi:hypothetical protein